MRDVEARTPRGRLEEEVMARRQTEKVEHIKSVPMFAKLSQRQLQRVARHADEVTVEEGRVLSREGTPGGHSLLIILEGKASVKRDGTTLARLGPGEFVGEMSLLDNKPHSATVTAETEATLLTIGRREFMGLLEDVPGLKDNIMLGLVERLRAADERIIC
jgi:CRP/FNR family transcriptional regulator, cyclic AMP receptor protein